MDVKELLWSYIYVCVCLTSIKCLRSTIYSQKRFKPTFSIFNKMVNLELIYGLCLSKLWFSINNFVVTCLSDFVKQTV